MTEHVVIHCEKCRRGLRVRVKYLGQKVGCNFCGHCFVARIHEESESSLVAPVPPSPIEEAPGKTTGPQETEGLREELARLKANHDDIAVQFLEANNQRNTLLHRVLDLDGQLSLAREQVRLAHDELASCHLRLAELDRLQVEAGALQERAMRTLTLEDDLGETRARVRSLEEEIQTIRIQSAGLQRGLDESATLNARLQEEIPVLSVDPYPARPEQRELDRRNDEVVAFRALLHAQSLEDAAKLVRFVRERDEAVCESAWLRREWELVGAGLTTAREEIERLASRLGEIVVDDERLEVERESVARLRCELPALVAEREHALEAQLDEVSDTCVRLESERSTASARWDRERAEGLVELQKLVLQLATVRSERDDLLRTSQTLRREFEELKNRRLLDSEGQQSLELELRTLRPELDRLRSESEVSRRSLADALHQIGALQQELEQRERDSVRAAGDDRAEIERRSRELADAIRDGESKAIRIAELTQRIGALTKDDRSKRCDQPDSNELPPRPQFSPEGDQNAFQAALNEWADHARRKRDQVASNLASIEGELQSAHGQLQLFQRDLALGDLGGLSLPVAYPFDEE